MPLNSKTFNHLPNSSNIFCFNSPSRNSPWVGIRNSTDYSPFSVELDVEQFVWIGNVVHSTGRYGTQMEEVFSNHLTKLVYEKVY